MPGRSGALFRQADRLMPLIGAVGIIIWFAGTARLLGISEFIGGQLANLGAGVTSGGIVTWAVLVLQQKNDRLAQRRADDLRVEMERRQLALSISLQTDLAAVTLADLDLRGLVLSRKRFVGAVLRRCDLRRVRLDGANLSDADLREARLEDADLRGAIFGRCDLSRAQLQRADLRGADLNNADLRFANFANANLVGASLAGAHLDHTVLTNADLLKADLSGIDRDLIVGALNVSPANPKSVQQRP